MTMHISVSIEVIEAARLAADMLRDENKSERHRMRQRMYEQHKMEYASYMDGAKFWERMSFEDYQKTRYWTKAFEENMEEINQYDKFIKETRIKEKIAPLIGSHVYLSGELREIFTDIVVRYQFQIQRKPEFKQKHQDQLHILQPIRG